MEYKFEFIVYSVDADEASALREHLQDMILAEIERLGLFMSPVICEEVEDGETKNSQ